MSTKLRPGRAVRAACALVALLACGASASSARAGGLYFSDRGVRPMGRAGAFVAGADDLGAIWYNPAGIADAGSSALVDFASLIFQPTYTRELRIVDADGTVRIVPSPTIKGSSEPIPLPTLAASFTLDTKKQWTVAVGGIAPYVALASYAPTVDGQPSPARYTLGSFDGSLLAIPGAWLAWKPIPQLRVGAGVFGLVGWFQSTVTFSASPQDRLIGAPEQPELDAQSQLRVGPIIAPTANAGIIYEPDEHVRIGASAQLPMIIDSNATIKVRLGTSPAFDSASVNGDQAHVHFVLPAVARFGVELRPTKRWRIELSWVHEFWSEHDTITAAPKGITIDGIVGAPPSVKMPTIVIPRNFVDSNSIRLGAEFSYEISGYRVDQRFGVAYESSAVPNGYLSLSSLDFDKVNLTLGASLHLPPHWRFDFVYGHTFAKDAYVSPDHAQIPRINPLKGNAPLEAVNGGSYSVTADLIGVGFNYLF